ncbi:MAG: hypothetical protein ACM3U2_07360 [Deltaproteobacteria bacterium]
MTVPAGIARIAGETADPPNVGFAQHSLPGLKIPLKGIISGPDRRDVRLRLANDPIDDSYLREREVIAGQQAQRAILNATSRTRPMGYDP